MDAPTTSAVIETAGGRRFNLACPDPSLISMYDIAHALGHICRFTGHVSRFYSVAEHAVLCAELAGDRWGDDMAAKALHHDDAEAYISDLNSALKSLLGEPIRQIEADIMAAIWRSVGLDVPNAQEAQEMKVVDRILLATEAMSLMVSHGSWWDAGAKPDDLIDIHCWSPAEATEQFLDRCSEYGTWAMADTE